MIEAELPDGTILEFPDGTDPAVVQRVVKQRLGVSDPQPKTGGILSAAGVAPLRKEGQTFGQALRENIVGEGEVDTFGEQVGDVLGTAAAGGLRGIKGLLETPEMLFRLGKRTGQEINTLTGLRDPERKKTAIFDTYTGRGLERGYEGIANITGADPEGLQRRGETTAAQYAGTAGEFMGGAGGAGALGKLAAKGAKELSMGGAERVAEGIARSGLTREAQTAALTAGVGSEALGQATEGTAIEPYARLAGALVAPYSANKTLTLLQKKNAKAPTIKSLYDEKEIAYNELKSQGVGLTGTQTAYLVDDMRNAINTDDIILSAKPSLERALKLLDEVEAAGSMNLSKFNELEKALGKIYRSAPDAPEVLTMMNKMSDAIAKGSKDEALLMAAKAAYKKYSKAKMLDKYFSKSLEGAGKGKIISNSGEALQNTATRILRNDKNLKFWSDDEIAALQAVSQGNVSTRLMGALGKLSPTSGGLMAGLNMAVAFVSPFTALEIIGMTATTFSKLGYNAKVKASRKALEDLVRAGGVKQPSKVVTNELVEDMVARIGGLAAIDTQEQ